MAKSHRYPISDEDDCDGGTLGSAGLGKLEDPAKDAGGNASSGTSAKLKDVELGEVDGWADGLNINKDVC
jgi:hypothetical protein